jgi:mannose/cellobiose epimerase-like protein (N-acyl-D-glucosamine 2-epimerase family)
MPSQRRCPTAQSSARSLPGPDGMGPRATSPGLAMAQAGAEPGTAAEPRWVAEARDRALVWLRDAAWPLWLERGVDWPGRGFNESLDPRTLASPAGFRRLRVVARQTYVFSQAHRQGLPRAAEAVELGVEFLRRHALAENGGYHRHFDLANRPIDETRDLYDHAFVLLALASAAAVMPEAALRRQALDLLAYLDRNFLHPAGGYAESLPPTLPRRQNPHMHLLEACLAAGQAFGEEAFLHCADAMVRLFLSRFMDRERGALVEFFDDGLVPLRREGRSVAEPGHHSEWVWLLHWYGRTRPSACTVAEEIVQASAALMRFVDRFGVNPALGTVYDEVWSDGEPRSTGSRLWPQTERLKAEVLRADAGPRGITDAFKALERYLVGVPRGLWVEQLNADGTAQVEPAPASSLYHLTCGILVAGTAI